jgi:hypothetical protein
MFSPEAIRFLDLAPNESRIHGRERLSGKTEFVAKISSLTAGDGLALPTLLPLTAYFFEITVAAD